MTDTRIVCTHDAGKLAETLTRLLEAEGHRVRLASGRQALSELALARTTRDAVLLIWSPNARSQTYMLEWARNIDPMRLVEIALTPDWPRITRKAPVIDFAHWRGERGERAAWNALVDRLRTVDRIMNPPKAPPKMAMFALGAASAAAVTGAIVMRVNEPPIAPVEHVAQQEVITLDASTGVGGPLSALEPASLDEERIVVRMGADIPLLRTQPPVALADLPEPIEYELRDPTLMERLYALNPLRSDND